MLQTKKVISEIFIETISGFLVYMYICSAQSRNLYVFKITQRILKILKLRSNLTIAQGTCSLVLSLSPPQLLSRSRGEKNTAARQKLG